jgi:hypothetical protein
VSFQEPQDLSGDPDKTRNAMAKWTDGQKECRARGRHLYAGLHTYVYGKDPDKIGTRMDIIQQCRCCYSVRRHAEHVRTARGLRRAEDWKPDYREHRDVPYLLPKGAARLDDGDHEELTAFLFRKQRLTFVTEDDDTVNQNGQRRSK